MEVLFDLYIVVIVILSLVIRDLVQQKALSGISFVLSQMQLCVTVARSPVKVYAECTSDQVVSSL